MSILGSIMSSILGGRSQPAPPPAAPSRAKAAPPIAPTPETHGAAPHDDTTRSAPPPTPTADRPATPPDSPVPPAAAGTATHAATQVDVAAVLDKRAEEVDADLDWRTSIVDLLKLLKLDPSLPARKTLARELHYTGSTKDSAAMNIWLHKQVMAKLAQGGGKLPDELLH